MTTENNILGGSFFPAEKLFDLECIKTPINEINEALGGGLPRGRVIEIYADKSEGKTTFCQWIVQFAQKEGLNCSWGDAEGTFHKPYASGAGIDLSKLSMIDFSTGEDLLYKIKMALATNYFDIIILDSINSVTPATTSESKIDKLNMSEKLEPAKMWATFFKELDGGYEIKSPKTGKFIINETSYTIIDQKTLQEKVINTWHKMVDKKTVLIMINHRMDTIGGFMKTHYTPGGRRKDFTFSLRLNLTKRKTVTRKVKGVKTLRYKLIEMKPDKNKVGIPLISVFLQFNLDGTIQLGNKTKAKFDSEEVEEVEEVDVPSIDLSKAIDEEDRNL